MHLDCVIIMLHCLKNYFANFDVASDEFVCFKLQLLLCSVWDVHEVIDSNILVHLQCNGDKDDEDRNGDKFLP